jgi:hypothetical protein
VIPEHSGALRRAGLEVVGALGPGADGLRWAVRDQAGDRWAATVLVRPAGVERARLRNRVARLAALDHPHLVRVGPLIDLPGGGLVVLHREVLGADLRTVAAGRGPWTPGEVVTVVVPLAEALAALHRAGLSHGDVAPGNVMLADGRPVLVDVVCADGPRERGTPGFAAPERPDGATAAGDVYALGRLGLHLLQEGGAADADDAAARLRECLARTGTRPHERPTAAELAADVYACCAPEPIRLPEAAVLTQVAIRRLSGGDDLLTERAPARTRGRHRRPRHPARVAAAAALGAVACAAAVGLARGVLAGDQPAAADERTTSSQVAALGTDPLAAAVRLTRERATALAAADRHRLATVTAPGSPAAVADAAAVIDPRRWRPGGQDEVLVVVEGLGRRPGCPAGPVGQPVTPDRCVRVELIASVGTGAVLSERPAASRSVVLVLRPTTGGWRVSEVEPAVP